MTPERPDQQTHETYDDPVDALAALGEPARRALYDYVVARGRPVSRDEAADAVEMKRATAAFHLDRLAEGGLLDVQFRRLTGRSGPGAGRPAKLYTRAAREFEVTLPPRRYALAGDLLASVLDAVHDDEPSVDKISAEVAHDAGHALADGGGELREVLTQSGFEPRECADGSIVLANCPFHELAQRHTRLVCGMNLHLLAGLLEGLGEGGQAVLDPDEDRCCVRIWPTVETDGDRATTGSDGPSQQR